MNKNKSKPADFTRASFKTVITPQFYQNFQCIGSECENNCCHHWNVTLDRETYKDYKEHGDIKIRQIANKQTKSCGKDSIHYRQIKLEDNGNCPLLEDSGLCYVHKNHGEDLLPPICKVYPREDKLVGDELHSSLSISCPEAARKILLDSSAMSFDVKTVKSGTKLPSFVSKVAIDDTDLQRQFKQVAYNCVLAENTDTVEGRLFNLAILFRMASQRLEAGGSLGTLLGAFDEMIVTDELNQVYRDTDPAQKVQEFVVQELLKEYGFGAGNLVFLRAWAQALTKLKKTDSYDADNEKITLTDFYDKHCRQGYESLVDSHGYSLINFMLHWIYSTAFDLTNGKELFAQFAVFTLKFFYIRTLCGMLQDGADRIGGQETEQEIEPDSEPDNAALLVSIIHSISRKSDHDKHFSTIVYAGLVERGLTEPEHILGLIKV